MRLSALLAAILAFVATCAATAHAAPFRTEHVAAELVSERAAIAPGDRFHVALRQAIIPNWHTYWRNPGDAGEPTTLTWTLPTGFAAGEIQWPTPERIALATVMDYGYSGEVLFPVEIVAPQSLRPGRSITLSAQAMWLVCKDICILEEGPVSITLPVAAAARDDPTWKPRLDAARTALPRVGEGVEARISAGAPAALGVVFAEPAETRAAYFYPYSRDVISHIAAQGGAYGERGITLTLEPGVAKNLGTAELSGVLAFEQRANGAWERRAIEIAAAPGDPLPGAPPPRAPQNALGAAGEPGQGADLTLPLALLFAFLGGLILNVMPCVLPVLSIKALGIAQGAQAGHARRHGALFVAGVLTTFLVLAGALIALKSAGAAVGWGFQLQEPALVAALALLFFVIGLNLLGAFEITGLENFGGGLAGKRGDAGAFFTGALAVVAATPCTAPFMAGATGFAVTQSAPVTLAVFLALGLGFATPLAAIAFAPGLRKLVPRPGPWMDRLKQVLAFPMFGASVWLVFVLAMQTGAMGAAALLAIALAIGFAVVAVKWGRIWAGVALSLLAIVGAVAWRPLTTPAQAIAASSEVAALPSEPWSAARVEALRAEGRPIFVNFTAAWCITCQVNEGVALSRARVAEAFTRANVAYLKGDWTNRDAAIAAELAAHARAGVPLYLYYAPNAEQPRILPQLLSEDLLIKTVGTGELAQGDRQ
ncbi:MAG: thioredoxin family protein [Hyphomonadaceae bacterium]|nr:thioredoxin family protein [Hyphomonadaceae bacterium]